MEKLDLSKLCCSFGILFRLFYYSILLFYLIGIDKVFNKRFPFPCISASHYNHSQKETVFIACDRRNHSFTWLIRIDVAVNSILIIVVKISSIPVFNKIFFFSE